ncbi:uncharacterized protein EDB91DRAFT_1125503 [Suillus paluster]|uniref:uncharacterized protein n=1 Tax=Suillus paluster TaxID=48578 RepID=UPI001B878D38|nr:uncharacterized protein EDB91DRAFT_1125503 [Suillus paluster]KAG1743703.1 hypothetical protein EDB91DRAFT_1125503 [Suillus paluster]
MCETFAASKPAQGITHARPIVYISAEDFNGPAISVRYTETKLEVRRKIKKDHPQYRAVHVRPSMIYDPETRPMTIPVNLFTFSAWVHAAMVSLAPSAWVSMATLMNVPPIRVDHAEANLAKNVTGPVGTVRAMRELIGWSKGGNTTSLDP